MVIVNTNTNIVHENATPAQASIIIGVDKKMIARWEETLEIKKCNHFILYFKVIKLKKYMMANK